MVCRERIEWCDVWVEDGESADLPRLLLVGDSIARSYYQQVQTRVCERFACARVATSKCAGDPAFLKELQLVVDEYEFAVVHFNNGLHGVGYDENTYSAGMSEALELFNAHSPATKVILATSTPIWSTDHPDTLDPRTDRVRERNRIVTTLAAERGVPVNDLFDAVVEHPEFFSSDGVHFLEAGQVVLGALVAGEVINQIDPEQDGGT